MKYRLLLFLLCLTEILSAQQAALDIHAQRYLAITAGADQPPILPDFVYKQTSTGICISAFIKVQAHFDETPLRQLGVHIGTRAGSVYTVQIPLKQVFAFTQLPGIQYIEFDQPIGRYLDSVRVATRVDSVQAGINLPMPYTGKDVVVGIVDIGFDFSHPSFFDTTGTTYRIKRAWLEKTPGTPPSGFSYGTEITDSSALFAAHSDNINNSHGSHVAGIAAGSGRAPGAANGRFRGMAFESEIVLVGILTDSLQWQNTGMSDMVDGMNYIYRYAQSVGKPCVINLSWGSGVGPHDGSSLFGQACDALTGPGKIFVCAAGNTGDTRNHLMKSFTSTDTALHSFVVVNPYNAKPRTWIDIWATPSKSACVVVSLYKNGVQQHTPLVCTSNQLAQYALVGSNGDTCFVQFTSQTAAFNGKARFYLGIENRTPDSVLLSVTSTDNQVQVFQGYVSNATNYIGSFTAYGKAWATEGNTDYTVSDIGTTISAITVGAYASKISFRNISSQTVSYGSYARLHDLVPFSSRGPTVDGRVKPEITAPGMGVASAVNSYDGNFLPSGGDFSSNVYSFYDSAFSRKRYYAVLSGTSMASPATAGIVALLLQIKPNLTPTQIKQILATTAIQDSFTTALPATGNNDWGHGKVNGYGAVLMAQAIANGINETSDKQTIRLYPNPVSVNAVLEFTAAEGTADIACLNQNGALVNQWSIFCKEGVNHVQIPFTGATGIYFLRVTQQGKSHVVMAVKECME
ncbi:MAG: S8 family peptidase [Chitinophagales bacterium]